MYYSPDNINEMRAALMGKTITKATLSENKETLSLQLKGGSVVDLVSYGDCCSETWIEGLDLPKMLLGKVQNIEYIDMPQLSDPYGGTVIQYYGLRITTNKGSCVIDFRNSSNGYYGGWLTCVVKDTRTQ